MDFLLPEQRRLIPRNEYDLAVKLTEHWPLSNAEVKNQWS